MPHPFDNPAYAPRPGDRFILTRPESPRVNRYLVEITAKRFERGTRDGQYSADDIEIHHLGYCDERGAITGKLEFDIHSRVPHGWPLQDCVEALPAALEQAA